MNHKTNTDNYLADVTELEDFFPRACVSQHALNLAALIPDHDIDPDSALMDAILSLDRADRMFVLDQLSERATDLFEESMEAAIDCNEGRIAA